MRRSCPALLKPQTSSEGLRQTPGGWEKLSCILRSYRESLRTSVTP